jgi:hypothetical protein
MTALLLGSQKIARFSPCTFREAVLGLAVACCFVSAARSHCSCLVCFRRTESSTESLKRRWNRTQNLRAESSAFKQGSALVCPRRWNRTQIGRAESGV